MNLNKTNINQSTMPQVVTASFKAWLNGIVGTKVSFDATVTDLNYKDSINTTF